jgi:protein-S-isoprenylcysteine O-methyltransferase Ste14
VLYESSDLEANPLPKIALVVGVVLIVVGGWAYLASGPDASPTALIPAVLGLGLAVAGLVGLRSGSARRNAMHAAAVVALLGVLGSLGQLIGRPAAGSDDADIATTAGLLNLALCGVFLVLAVWSFVQARRARV